MHTHGLEVPSAGDADEGVIGAARQGTGRSVRTREDDEVDDTGRVHIGYQMSYHYGLGSVECWVDQGARTRIDGWWMLKERNMGM
jgi:hypothetical protein